MSIRFRPKSPKRSKDIHPRIFIDISIGFCPATPVGEALAVTDKITKNLQADIPNSEVRILLCREEPKLS